MSGVMHGRLSSLVSELAQVMGSRANVRTEVEAGHTTSQRHWVATLTASGDHAGRCAVVIDHDSAAAFTRLAAGRATDVEDASVADMLREVMSEAFAALAARPAAERLELALITLEPRVATAQECEDAEIFGIAMPGLDTPMSVAVSWSEAPDLMTARVATTDDRGGRIEVILDIDLPVVVRFGHTELPLRALTRLGPGSVIDLGRSPDDPVEVLVSNRVVARGEVVVVGGNYGVRILDVTSQSDRARSMEG